MKNLQGRIKDKLHMIRDNKFNNMMKCIRDIKGKIKSNKSLTLFISFVILFALAIIILAVNETSNAIITFVGIVLAFISIFLSYKGLMVTNQVKEDIALQQYKLKQQEVVANLVAQINEYSFYLDFRDYNLQNDKYIIYETVSLGEVNVVNNIIKEYYPEFLDCKIGLADSIQFEPFEKLSISAYLPTQIAGYLRPFCRNYWNETNLDKSGIMVTFDKLDEGFEKSYRLPNDTFPDWKTFVKKVVELIDSINDWYTKENNNIKPNIRQRPKYFASDKVINC